MSTANRKLQSMELKSDSAYCIFFPRNMLNVIWTKYILFYAGFDFGEDCSADPTGCLSELDCDDSNTCGKPLYT